MSDTSGNRARGATPAAIGELETIGLAAEPVTQGGVPVERVHEHLPHLPATGSVFVSRYEITRAVGRGGFGAVYAASDRLTGATVAIKIMQRGLGDELEEIRREATVLRLLRLPGAALLLDEGVEGAWPFLVMEFAEGAPFPGVGGRVDWRDLREPVVALLEVLARVHAHGVLHRDLKPGNVLVDEHGRVTVVDFGLSRARDDLRRDSEVAGTPAYIAPEQLDGLPADPRSDIYAVGTMVFEALSGSLPFEASTSRNFLSRKRTTTPRSLGDVAPHVPPHVVAAVDLMLSRDPGDRPRSASAALALLRGEPVRDVVSELVETIEGSCTRTSMPAWFRGPERYVRLRSDAASELWRRTDGNRERVERELRAWLRAGVARLVDGMVEVPRPQLERLRSGLQVLAPDEPDAADGATSAPRERRRIHAELAASLPAGARGRLLHLAQTGSLDEVLEEAIATAERSIADGSLDEAVAAVQEGMRLLRLLPGHLRAARLLTLLAQVALLQGSEIAVNTALYHLDSDAFDEPGLDWLRALVRAMWLELRGDRDRAMAAARSLGPALEDELEWWRLAIIGQCGNRLDVAEHERVVHELIREYIDGRPAVADLAHHLLGRVRYRQGRFEDSARAYEQSAALRAQPTRRLSSRLNAASAWMEAGCFDEAIAAASQARVEAAAVRHAVFEARAEWIERASQYRQGIDLAPEPTIAESAPAIGVPWLMALMLQSEAAFAWRTGDLSHAIACARLGAKLGGGDRFNGVARLCDAFASYLSGGPSHASDQDFEETIRRLTAPAMAEQIAWLLWQATGEQRWERLAERYRDEAERSPGGVRREVVDRFVAERRGVRQASRRC